MSFELFASIVFIENFLSIHSNGQNKHQRVYFDCKCSTKNTTQIQVVVV